MSSADNKIKIFIVGSDPLSRIGIRNILLRLGDVSLTDCSSAEACSRYDEARWDLIIFAISTSLSEDLEILEKIIKGQPVSPVMILDSYNNLIEIQAIKLGAKSYLNKTATDTDILSSANILLSGRMYITDSMAEQIAFALSANAPAIEKGRLSEKELTILKLMAIGKCNRHIAEQLNISLQYVSFLKSRVRKKIGKKTHQDILKYALKIGLVSLNNLLHSPSDF